MITETAQDRLITLLKPMDLPAFRKTKMTSANILWLARNIRIRNEHHKNCKDAFALLISLLGGEK